VLKGASRVQIPPSPLNQAEARMARGFSAIRGQLTVAARYPLLSAPDRLRTGATGAQLARGQAASRRLHDERVVRPLGESSEAMQSAQKRSSSVDYRHDRKTAGSGIGGSPLPDPSRAQVREALAGGGDCTEGLRPTQRCRRGPAPGSDSHISAAEVHQVATFGRRTRLLRWGRCSESALPCCGEARPRGRWAS
jgi:hypothetical protein